MRPLISDQFPLTSDNPMLINTLSGQLVMQEEESQFYQVRPLIRTWNYCCSLLQYLLNHTFIS